VSDGPFGRRSGGEPPVAPEPASSPAPPPRTSSITWIVGVAVVLALGYITFNSLRTQGPGSEGIGAGEKMPLFAAPLASGSLEGDAQVDPGRVCSVRGPDVLNSCALRERDQPIALAFLATRSKQCEEQVDVLDRVARSHPEVSFAAIGIRGEKAELAKVAAGRWTIPVAHDRDGAVANLFAVAICPTITFARAGGIVKSTSLGLVGEAEIERRLAELR
jgi:hypothetical protein